MTSKVIEKCFELAQDQLQNYKQQDDKRMLEKAAALMGYTIIGYFVKTGLRVWNKERTRGFKWNPLVEDDDAFQLAVALGISINHDEPIEVDFFMGYGEYEYGVEAWKVLPADHTVNVSELYGDDRAAATRRAIVTAAAAIYDQKELT